MSNTLHFDGRMVVEPKLTKHGKTSVCKFTLKREENAGKDEDGNAREKRAVAVQFVAFNELAQIIADNVLIGDQLIVTARIENNNYTDKDDVKHYGFNFVIESFDFGAPGKAKRAQLAKDE